MWRLIESFFFNWGWLIMRFFEWSDSFWHAINQFLTLYKRNNLERILNCLQDIFHFITRQIFSIRLKYGFYPGQNTTSNVFSERHIFLYFAEQGYAILFCKMISARFTEENILSIFGSCHFSRILIYSLEWIDYPIELVYQP